MMTKRPGVSAIFVLAALSSVPAPAQTKPGLDTTTFVVMGEGLAAGMANFGLSTVVQQYSFPNLVAAQMGTAFTQPLIQPPGIGDVIGYPGQEVRLQAYPQGSVRQFYVTDPDDPVTSPPIFITNLSVPGFTLADAVNMRPQLPIAQRNMKQTVVNMTLGFPQLFIERVPLWSQFEYAKALFPTVALVELGYYEALDAAVSGDPSRIPAPSDFGTRYGAVLAGLRGLHAQVIATTIPNPIDTAYFNSPDVAAAINGTYPFVITIGYRLSPQDYVTRNGLMEIANQFGNNTIAPLPPGSTMTAAMAADITARVNALNAQIVNVAREHGAVVWDLNAFFRRVRTTGVQAGGRTLTADYMGGFYSMDAVYPGSTGQALIANDLIAFLNSTYQKNFTPVDVLKIAAHDQSLTLAQPKGAVRSAESLGLAIPEEVKE